MSYTRRNLADKLENTAKTFSATYLSGPRQCGKSTLVRNLLPSDSANYLTFDSVPIRTAAAKDPEKFIAKLPQDKLNIIDEVQRVPEVYLQLKKWIDERRFEGRGRGRFLLTGSANIFALPGLANAMVGRMAVMTLYPFSAAEVSNSGVNFIDRLWNDSLSIKNCERADLVKIIKDATFPELALNGDIDRSVWLDGYFDTMLDRDAAEFAKIRKPELIYHLLVSLSGRVGSLMNNDSIMRETGLNQGTFERYKSLCEAAFLTFELQPWAKPNRLKKRFVKSKKIYFTDTNFLCFLARRDISEVYEKDPALMGHFFENFIATEIMKSISALPGKFYVSHFNPVREDGKETDFVIEKDNGETIAIEVKLDSSLNSKDFKNLELCRDTIDDKFKKGIVVYTGDSLVPFGDKLWAVPVSYLWDKQKSRLS
ncbi:MAG: ATP-binding protein [Chitinispirillales bacterium]|jgi:predicted AAA+ superfamily ATPase|nr:ATP-binding protein [Chitinispirillales bacterium]